MSNWNRRWLFALAGALILVAAGLGAMRADIREEGSHALDVAPPSASRARPAEGGGPDQTGEAAPAASRAGSQPTARLLLPSGAVPQWETLKFSLEGFQPEETVTLQVKDGDSFKEIGQVLVDGEGKAADAEILLPSWLESGTREVQAVGDSGQTMVLGTMHVRAKELWANLSSYSFHQASKLGFVAGGFQPGDQVNVYLSQGGDACGVASQRPLASVKTDEAGNTTWTEFEVPVVQPGEYVLLMKGDRGEELKTKVEVMPLAPELELSPWSGLPGRQVDINARGFLPDEKVELFLGSAREPVITFTADRYGDIWGGGPISMPMESQGEKLAVTLRGQRSGAVVTRDFAVIAPHPWIDLSSYSGYAGTGVTVKGGGFAAGERVTLHLGSASGPVVGEVVADEQGRYQGLGPAQVPADAEQAVVFVALGESSGAQASATFKVQKPFHPEIPGESRR